MTDKTENEAVAATLMEMAETVGECEEFKSHMLTLLKLDDDRFIKQVEDMQKECLKRYEVIMKQIFNADDLRGDEVVRDLRKKHVQSSLNAQENLTEVRNGLKSFEDSLRSLRALLRPFRPRLEDGTGK